MPAASVSVSERTAYLAVKRVVDIVISGTALIVLLPLFLGLIIILKSTGEGEIFFAQIRVGYLGRRFKLLKFVTMVKNSPNIGTRTITAKDDPRVLPLGRLLRKSKINELPQILNVLKGDMSLVGPRPQTEECFSYFPEKDRDRICLLQPGLTGIGSIVFRDEEEIIARSSKPYDRCFAEDIQPYKHALELWYLENRTLLLDLKIMALTAIAIVFPRSQLHKKCLCGLPECDQEPSERRQKRYCSKRVPTTNEAQ